MRILIDECIDRRAFASLRDHTVRTVPQEGWAGLKNGKLLTEAQKHLDVFITVDQNLTYQQNISRYEIVILVLRTKTNRLEDLKPVFPKIQKILASPLSRQIIYITS